jgi:hypothetical protein
MTHSSSQRGSGPSESSRKDYPDRSVLGGEIGIWSRDLNSVAAPQAREVAAEIEELGYAVLLFGEVLGRDSSVLGSSSLLGAAHRTQRYTLWIGKLAAPIVPTVKRLRVIVALTISSALRVEV